VLFYVELFICISFHSLFLSKYAPPNRYFTACIITLHGVLQFSNGQSNCSNYSTAKKGQLTDLRAAAKDRFKGNIELATNILETKQSVPCSNGEDEISRRILQHTRSNPTHDLFDKIADNQSNPSYRPSPVVAQHA
jgi:hypothetical protein